MRSTSKILLNKVTDEVVIELLRAVLPVLEAAGIDYFVVGAFARDLEMLAKGHTDPPPRKTKDVDLAVMVGSLAEYDALKAALADLPEFEPSEKEPYRLLFRKAYEVDFLPFGEIANEKGQIELLAKTAFTLEMPGFSAVQPFAEIVETEEGLTLHVSSLAGIVLLKLLAWQDRPEREKDIHDIDYILKNFLWLHMEEMMENDDDLLALYAAEEKVFEQSVSARYVGRQIRIMLENDAALRDRLLGLLEEQSKGFNMARLMSPEFTDDSQRIIKALYHGILDTPHLPTENQP
jgi:predicted nucleotidyltransferase